MAAQSVLLSDVVSELQHQSIQATLFGNDVAVCGVSIDSRRVTEGNLFICKGAAFRPAFLGSALEAGAAAYLCDAASAEALAEFGAVPHIVVDDIRRAMAFASAFAYRRPDEKLTLFGITGTKGKSTVAYMLRSIMRAANQEPSMLGSIETDDGLERFESHNTTPEAPDLWRHLSNTVEAGRAHMIMEVSSQGLKYDRVLGLPFDIACFLNIGRDHISPCEHADFEDYFTSKLRIFEQCEAAVVNLDCDHAERVLDAAQGVRRLVTVSAHDEAADYFARSITAGPRGIAFDLVTEKGVYAITLGMAGLFNVGNALAAAAMAHLAGMRFEAIAKGLAHLRVPGRMELLASSDERIVAIVDYAHNQLSFEALFASVREEYPGRRVFAVFGAPGDKAVERREQLPRAAGRFADMMIFTEEDPAHERVEDICAQLAANVPDGAAFEVECNREKAIERAFELAAEQPSVVLLLAKGDETRQHRGDDYVEVESDLSIARRLLALR